MNAKQMLLHTPEGVRDLYGKEYERQRSVERLLHRQIRSFGYRDIRTPMFEYFDVFSKEVGTTPSSELYKFFDRENNTLVLRPDFTPSVARCAAKYFLDEETKETAPGSGCAADAPEAGVPAGGVRPRGKAPLRLAYLGSAFTNRPAHQGKFCESGQIGAELIGDGTVYADAEILALAIQTISATGLPFAVSVGEVEYFKGLCEEAGLSEETEERLRAYLAGKNPVAAEELLQSCGVSEESRAKLLRLAVPLTDADALEELEAETESERARAAIRRLRELCRVLALYGVEGSVSFDLGLLSEYHYYTGIIFQVYALGAGSPVAKGGRYDELLRYFGKDAPAVGFVLRIDELMEALASHPEIEIPVREAPEVVFFDPGDEDSFRRALAEAKERRKRGEAVVLEPAR